MSRRSAFAVQLATCPTPRRHDDDRRWLDLSNRCPADPCRSVVSGTVTQRCHFVTRCVTAEEHRGRWHPTPERRHSQTGGHRDGSRAWPAWSVWARHSSIGVCVDAGSGWPVVGARTADM